MGMQLIKHTNIFNFLSTPKAGPNINHQHWLSNYLKAAVRVIIPKPRRSNHYISERLMVPYLLTQCFFDNI